MISHSFFVVVDVFKTFCPFLDIFFSNNRLIPSYNIGLANDMRVKKTGLRTSATENEGSPHFLSSVENKVYKMAKQESFNLLEALNVALLYSESGSAVKTLLLNKTASEIKLSFRASASDYSKKSRKFSVELLNDVS